MNYGDDFKNFLVIQKMEEDNKNKTFLDIILKNKFKIISFIIFILFFIFIYNIFFSKINFEKIKNDNNINNNIVFQINNGESIKSIADNLEERNIIKSAFTFRLCMKIFGSKSFAQAGIYEFNKEDNLVSIVNKIRNAKYSVSAIRITIPEGSTNIEISNIISKDFLNASSTLYKEVDDFSFNNVNNYLDINKQGFLFPETYFFLPNTSINDIVKSLQNKSYENLKVLFSEASSLNEDKNNIDKDFNVKIYNNDISQIDLTSYFDDTNKEINKNKKLTIINDQGTTTMSINDIMIMASYLEGEANNEKDMRIVSGILWSRLKIGYYLQIDAATSTYKSKGLTKTPINNPGIIAIKAAMNPIQTGNLYYLTGKDGQMYYAKDYETHLLNIKKHLK